jgi:hypothetical protein
MYISLREPSDSKEKKLEVAFEFARVRTYYKPSLVAFICFNVSLVLLHPLQKFADFRGLIGLCEDLDAGPRHVRILEYLK